MPGAIRGASPRRREISSLSGSDCCSRSRWAQPAPVGRGRPRSPLPRHRVSQRRVQLALRADHALADDRRDRPEDHGARWAADRRVRRDGRQGQLGLECRGGPGLGMQAERRGVRRQGQFPTDLNGDGSRRRPITGRTTHNPRSRSLRTSSPTRGSPECLSFPTTHTSSTNSSSEVTVPRRRPRPRNPRYRGLRAELTSLRSALTPTWRRGVVGASASDAGRSTASEGE